MKILMVMKRLDYSGAPKMFMWLAHALAESGHEVHVFTFMKQLQNIDLPKELHWKNINLEEKSFFSKIWVIRKVLKDLNPEVSISFLLDANVYNMFACLGLRTKSVVCERNDPFKPGYYVLKFWKPFFRLAKGAVYQLESVKSFYRCIKAPTAVIPNPITCRVDLDCPSFACRKNAIVSLGRLDLFQKRLDVLIQAFEIFSKSFPDYELHIYGDGKDFLKIQTLVSKSRASSKIRLMGVTDTPQETIKQYKLFVQTSDFEGIPNSLIEAMSVGLPCVATDCRPGGAKFLIQNGVNGILVPRGNPNVIAREMTSLVEKSDMADSMGERAKQVRSRLSPKKITSMWNEYLNALCK